MELSADQGCITRRNGMAVQGHERKQQSVCRLVRAFSRRRLWGNRGGPVTFEGAASYLPRIGCLRKPIVRLNICTDQKVERRHRMNASSP
jgi:hypothetical protein